ncbi:MAG TPA: acyl-CoA dehydrogenase family protein [Burkholderiales bacterium]|nr:acyl-CoA dehydrogenase family protein [Burkholderiales bacterium]
MNFDTSEEQQLFSDSVRRTLARDYDFEARKRTLASEAGWSEQVWERFAEIGLTGLPFPAEHGGFGGGAVDLMGVMEAFGEALVLEPYLATVLAGRLVAQSPQARAILPAVVEGRLRLALAHGEIGARHRVDHVTASAWMEGGHWRLEGEKAAVSGAPMAGRSVVPAQTSQGIELFLATPDAVRAYRALDGTVCGDVVFRKAKADRLGGGLAALEEALDFGTALVCAEAVGVMKSACEATLEYLKTRKQFGVPIGSFQALQHRMVDMFIAQEQARSMACLACSKVDANDGPRDRQRAVSAAKIRIADAARLISQEAVQLHGGMGMTEELKVSHSFRRLTVLAVQFGDADHHLARFASL